ncbi:aldehyde dehydrogenase family protein [Aerococcaceae bacterium DSM 111020]|nr:aldehyde dehydrogenase family protein [Aerococcaceae bacterium DSM 111020]
MKQYQNYINGQWMTSNSNEMTAVLNPATEETIAEVTSSNNEDVDKAVQAAKDAFSDWNSMGVDARLEYLEKLYEIIVANKQRIADTIVQELGASQSFSESGHVPQSVNEMRAMLDDVRDFSFEEKMDTALIQKEGFGVVACITPWNYPFNQIQRKITPALIAGNTVVVKPANDTPLSAILYAELIEEAGLPAGVFNVVTGSGSTVGDYLAGHEDVSVISFTGSTEVGRGLYDKASDQIKKLVLELGGKSAMIGLPGADKHKTVKQSVDTVLNNSGQTCAALTRLIIPEEEKAEYLDIIKKYYEENAQVGDPTDENTKVGPMVSEKQKETVMDYIQKGKEEGAKVFIGGNAIDGRGFFVEPTVFIDVDNKMTIAQEEIFGPVLAVLTYNTVEEAIEIANDSPYGLSGAVTGPNDEEALEVAKQIRSGNVYVNQGPRSPRVPFGGYKQSGLGREVGIYGIEDYLEIKSIMLPE